MMPYDQYNINYDMIGRFLRDAEFALEEARALLLIEERSSAVERRVGRLVTQVNKAIIELEGVRPDA